MRAVFIFLSLLVFACGTEKEREDKAVFRNATFGFEAFARQTFETTYRHNEIFVMPAGSNAKKYLDGPENNYFGYFPADSLLAKKLNLVFIDTTNRGQTAFPPTQRQSTLYLSPKAFSKEEYQLVVDFLLTQYAKPDKENTMLRWLNYSGPNTIDSVFWNTVFAVAYADLDSLQPHFRGANDAQWATLLINQTVDVAGNGLGMEINTSFFIRNDTLYCHTADGDLLAQLKTYKNTSGQTIEAYCKATKAIDNMDRFYLPPFK